MKYMEQTEVPLAAPGQSHRGAEQLLPAPGNQEYYTAFAFPIEGQGQTVS